MHSYAERSQVGQADFGLIERVLSASRRTVAAKRVYSMEVRPVDHQLVLAQTKQLAPVPQNKRYMRSAEELHIVLGLQARCMAVALARCRDFVG